MVVSFEEDENAKSNGFVQTEAKSPRRRVSFAPLAVPPPTEGQVPSSKKRWSLIRSLAKGKRLTSLTDEEDTMMRTLSSSEELGSFKKQPSTDEDEIEARNKLRKTIAIRSSMLNDAETKFLEDLIDTPDVTCRHIANVQKVLCNDPLYQEHYEVTPTTTTDSQEVTEEKNASSSSDRRSSLQEAPSYRKELWMQLRAEGEEMSVETFAFNAARKAQVQEVKEPKSPEVKEEKVKPDKRKSTKVGFFYKFQKALNLIDDSDKEEDSDTEVDDSSNDDLESDATFCILAHSIDDFLDHPCVLSPPIMDGLRAFLPFAVQHDNFWLKYSMVRDGASFYTLCDKIRNSARTIVAIETDQGEVFGSFTSSPWRVLPDGYYGSAEAFVWRLKKSRFTPCATVEDQIELENDVDVFEWSRINRNIQHWSGMDGEMSVGGGGYEDEPQKDSSGFGAAFSFSSDLSRGTTENCLTFNSPRLTSRDMGGVFNIANIEVWTLTPVLSLDEAERLELGRQFIFDHGGFVRQ